MKWTGALAVLALLLASCLQLADSSQSSSVLHGLKKPRHRGVPKVESAQQPEQPFANAAQLLDNIMSNVVHDIEKAEHNGDSESEPTSEDPLDGPGRASAESEGPVIKIIRALPSGGSDDDSNEVAPVPLNIPAPFAAFHVPVLSVASEPIVAQHSGTKFKEPTGLLNSFFDTFVSNQQKGFPFPQGAECEEDAHRLCPGVLKTCVGNFGCSLQCLTDHAPALSPACARAHPCYPDIDKFCVGIPPGKNEMMSCLKKHQSELSAECLAQHPCLSPKADKGSSLVAQDCKKLDYAAAGPAPSFVGDIGSFLSKLRSGDLFRPLTNMFHVAPPTRTDSPEEPLSTDEERKQLREERQELLSERQELEAERRTLNNAVLSHITGAADRPQAPATDSAPSAAALTSKVSSVTDINAAPRSSGMSLLVVTLSLLAAAALSLAL